MNLPTNRKGDVRRWFMTLTGLGLMALAGVLALRGGDFKIIVAFLAPGLLFIDADLLTTAVAMVFKAKKEAGGGNDP